MSNVPAGALRHRLLIQDQQATRDDDGVVRVSWVDLDTVWAAVEPLSAREFLQSGASQSNINKRVTIRSREIRPTMRFVHQTRYGIEIYNIAGVLSDKSSGYEYMTIPVSSGVNEGQ